MNRLLTIIFLSVVLSCVALGQSVVNWRGIGPLGTDRAKVRSLLGNPKHIYEHADLFFLSDEKVSVHYAQGPCKGFDRLKGVASGTVLELVIFPMQFKKFDPSMLDKNFVRSGTQDDLSFTYSDAQKGITYTINQFGELSSVLYRPSQAELKRLACKARK